jgi:hypothetical protein
MIHKDFVKISGGAGESRAGIEAITDPRVGQDISRCEGIRLYLFLRCPMNTRRYSVCSI